MMKLSPTCVESKRNAGRMANQYAGANFQGKKRREK